jgi:hypothetical protein
LILEIPGFYEVEEVPTAAETPVSAFIDAPKSGLFLTLFH